MGSNGWAGCGGVVRDDQGRWIAGFSKHIGSGRSFVAEMWGFRDGLVLCSNLNFQCLIVEVDAKITLLNNDYVNIVVSPLLDDCKQLLSRFQQVQVRHCYQQANHCADVMARMGSNQPLDYVLFHNLPVDVLEAFELGSTGAFWDSGAGAGAGAGLGNF
ncbi:hypothetical protein CMV_021021 [Castanea mollissima]|uniref:RNase H type-1 domain-containing protein n=1 Tax=Castanea mollissima TaxID=60419 RepID=A0A8J4VL15_9ROSI|nr:hypothetical protein CMV_021021 [Castanea mollissima]